MDKQKKARLQAKGWKVGTVREFLDLSDEEHAYVELKIALSSYLRQRRNELAITQVELAKRLGSSQSRVAKIEAADPTVSMDLLIRSLLALGTSKEELAAVIGH